MTVGQMTLEEVRSLASRETGLPVGIYRLTTRDGREMFDGHTLEDYHVDLGHTIYLENMDGWNKFLNLAIIGFTQQVSAVLSKHPCSRARCVGACTALVLMCSLRVVDLECSEFLRRHQLMAAGPVTQPPAAITWLTSAVTSVSALQQMSRAARGFPHRL